MPTTKQGLLDFVFDGPPGPHGPRFIECERNGKSVNVGEWLQRDDGYWVLRISYVNTYSQETKDAHGAVVQAGMDRASADEFILALRQLATMVHCDLTGELRQPHTLVPLPLGVLKL